MVTAKPLSLEQLRLLVPAYVLEALDPAERAAFERGLANPAFKSVLRAEVELQRITVEELTAERQNGAPRAVTQRMAAVLSADADDMPTAADFAPPPVLPDFLSWRNTDADDVPVARTRGRTPVPSFDAMPSDEDEAGHRTPLARHWQRHGQTVLAVMASLLLGVAAWQYRHAADLTARLDVATRVIETREADRPIVDPTPDGEPVRGLDKLFAGQVPITRILLEPVGTGRGGVEVFWNVAVGTAVIRGFALPPTAADRAYTLWMLRNKELVSVARFRADARGRALVPLVPMPGRSSGVSVFTLTVEPVTGSAQPTSVPLLVGDMPAPAPAAK